MVTELPLLDLLLLTIIRALGQRMAQISKIIKINHKNNRIIDWFGLEGTFRGHLVQSPCHGQGHLPLDQVAQSPVQSGLVHFEGRGIYHLSGQPVPVFHHPHCKFLPYIQSESAFF